MEDTYSTVQLKLHDCFNSLNDVSIKLAGARNALAKVETEVKELEKGVKESAEALFYIKKQDVISMEAYSYSKNRNETFEKCLEDAKVTKLVQESSIKAHTEERLKLLEAYNELEKKLKALGNNIINMVKND